MAMRTNVRAIDVHQAKFKMPLFKSVALKSGQNLVKYAMFDISAKAAIDAFPRAKIRRQISPWRTGIKDPTDAVEKRTNRFWSRFGAARRLVAGNLFDRIPFGIAQCVTLHLILPEKVTCREYVFLVYDKSFAKS